MKILFASMPFDGHFNPMTSLAVHLRERGHDVRWYTGPSYVTKLAALGIPHFCFQRARDVNAQNLVEVFPEYAKFGIGPKVIEFALTQIFFSNVEAHFRDIAELRAEFPFEAFFGDQALFASRLVAEKLQPNVYIVAPAPTPAPTSKQAPPPFFGFKPATTIFGRLLHRVVDAMVARAMRRGVAMFNDLRVREALPRFTDSVFDIHVDRAKAIFQIGVPSLDYPRDWPANFQFVGPLLPYKKPRTGEFAHEERLRKFGSLIAVSQGTVDNRDPNKLFVPALEALRGGPHLVVATTGFRNTEELRRRFPDENIIVEDYIDFDILLERADLFICNGGFGSILQAVMKGVPLLSAGKLEGKGDINARLDWSGVGLDLNTERPSPRQIRKGVARVLGNAGIARHVERLRRELQSYRPFEIIERQLEKDGLSLQLPSAPSRVSSSGSWPKHLADGA